MLYKHDCDKCVFLETFVHENSSYDLYICVQSGKLHASYISRMSSEGCDYVSYPGMLAKVSKNIPIQRAYVLGQKIITGLI